MKYLLLLISFANIVNAFTSINIYGTGLFLPYSMGLLDILKKI